MHRGRSLRVGILLTALCVALVAAHAAPTRRKTLSMLSADQIRPLIKERTGCIVSKRIVVDGAAVGYMQRHPPLGPEDSGWMFMAGDESQASNAKNAEDRSSMRSTRSQIRTLIRSAPDGRSSSRRRCRS
jgi:hypothetical protein